MSFKTGTKVLILFILIALGLFVSGCCSAEEETIDIEKETVIVEDLTVQPPEPDKVTSFSEELNTNSGTKCNCTFSITCKTILDRRSDDTDLDVVPPDGIIYAKKQVEFSPGDSAFDLLLRETRQYGIHMEFNKNPIYNSSYVEGIGNIYEFDYGPLSGWTYMINGETLGHGSSSHKLCDGDELEWSYTCDQGRDLDSDTGKEGAKN